MSKKSREIIRETQRFPKTVISKLEKWDAQNGTENSLSWRGTGIRHTIYNHSLFRALDEIFIKQEEPEIRKAGQCTENFSKYNL